jgi:hypothetical protein
MTTHENDEWIYVLDELPKEGEKVLCYGNKTICCEIDMQEAAEHEATYHLVESEWREDEKGNKYDIKTYHSFELEESPPYHLIFVSRWKRIK